MGTLPVAYGHAGDFLGFPLVPGDTAVQSFYAVSGFCVAVVLNEKYRPGSSTYSLFTSNRFLRLFPVYATVVCLPARCIGGSIGRSIADVSGVCSPNG